ncbi:MAG: hypothetical protein LBC48_02495, partial [Dysgonamonadaceae bacterium]|nr:hypothetical protein [Dysgonamonadaceae bacterium]
MIKLVAIKSGTDYILVAGCETSGKVQPASGIAVRLRAESPINNSVGQRPTKGSTILPPCRLKACHPNDYAPLGLQVSDALRTTGRCPVLMIYGLLALSLTAM